MNSIMLTIDTTGNPFKHLAAEGNIDATSDGTVQFFNLIRDWYSTMIVTGAVGLVCGFYDPVHKDDDHKKFKRSRRNKNGIILEDSYCICYMLLTNSFYDSMRYL